MRTASRSCRVYFPSGLFHGPAYGSDEPWAEDPVIYRGERIMLGVISHEGFGVLRDVAATGNVCSHGDANTNVVVAKGRIGHRTFRSDP